MTIYDAIGSGYVILTCCMGTATIVILAVFGLMRLAERLEIGQTYEQAGVRDALAKDDKLSIVSVKDRR